MSFTLKEKLQLGEFEGAAFRLDAAKFRFGLTVRAPAILFTLKAAVEPLIPLVEALYRAPFHPYEDDDWLEAKGEAVRNHPQIAEMRDAMSVLREAAPDSRMSESDVKAELFESGDSAIESFFTVAFQKEMGAEVNDALHLRLLISEVLEDLRNALAVADQSLPIPALDDDDLLFDGVAVLPSTMYWLIYVVTHCADVDLEFQSTLNTAHDRLIRVYEEIRRIDPSRTN